MAVEIKHFFTPVEEPVIPGESFHSRNYPWSNRKATDWIKDVEKKDAERLFAAVLMQSENRDLFWVNITRLQLIEAVKAYWPDDLDGFQKDVSKETTRTLSKVVIPIKEYDQDTKLATEASSIFARCPDLFPYLVAAKKATKIYSPEKIISAKSADPSSQLILGEITRCLNWDEQRLAQSQKAYQELVKLFWPVASAIAAHHRSLGPRSVSGDDWQGIAGIGLSLVVMKFYWETLVLDPTETIDIFRANLALCIYDGSSQKFDASALEVSVDNLDLYQSAAADDPAEIMLQGESERKVSALIDALSSSPKEAEILRLKIDGDLDNMHIMKKIGVTKAKVEQTLTAFKTKLRELAEKGELDFDVPAKKGFHEPVFWTDLQSKLEDYRRLYETNKRLLRPYFRDILEVFFEVQTGERASTLENVAEAFNQRYNGRYPRKAQISTVRRAIQRGIDRLNQTPTEIRKQQARANRYQSFLVIREAYNNQNIWQTLDPKIQEILQRFFLDDPDLSITQAQIAKDLGIDDGTASRRINRGILQILRLQGNPRSNPDLLRKPRHNLSK